MSQLSLEKSRESDCLLLNASPAVAQSHPREGMRDAYGGSQIEVSEWKEIEYVLSEDEEEESIPVIDPQGYNIELNQVIRNL